MRMLVWWMVACNPPLPEDTGAFADDSGETGDPGADADEDGFVAADDCDDRDPLTYPGAPEALDAARNDCDSPTGDVDQGIPVTEETRLLGEGDAFGYAAAAGDDVDGDGIDELVVGAPGGDGTVYLFSGLASAVPTSATGASITLSGTTAGAAFGAEVLLVDASPDARPDFVVGAPTSGAGAGSVWILDGRAREDDGGTAFATNDGLMLEVAPDANVYGFGRAIAFDEEHLFVGAPVGEGGSVHVYDASKAVVGTAQDPAILTGSSTGLLLGFDVASIDWDHDTDVGRDDEEVHPDDLVVGVPGFGVGAANRGAVAIFTTTSGTFPEYGTTGSPAIEGGGIDFVAIVGTNADDWFGSVVRDLGDVTGDGTDDLLVATGGGLDTGGSQRRFYVVDLYRYVGEGATASGAYAAADVALTTIDGFEVEAGALGPPEGVEVRDVDGDDVPDLVAGSPAADAPTVYVIDGLVLRGGGTVNALTEATASIVSLTNDDSFGHAVAAPPAGAEAPDLFVGAPDYLGAAGAVFYVPNHFPDLD